MRWNTLSIKEETQNNPQKTIKSTSPDSEGQKMARDWAASSYHYVCPIFFSQLDLHCCLASWQILDQVD